MFHMKHFTSENQKKGKLAEKICEKYLILHKYRIIDKNYTLSSGEVDIIAIKNKELLFIEVKSSFYKSSHVSYETYNPIENITKRKLNKIMMTSIHFLKHTKVSYETYGIYAASVYVDISMNKHRIDLFKIR